LDARAFRLDWPAGVRLFELDMPDVFDFKERVLRARGAHARCERIVVRTDLRDPGWPAALEAAGFRPAEATAWVVEGLLMYLTEEERDRLLAAIGELSATGSRLGLDHRPGFFAPPTLPGGEAVHVPAESVHDLSLKQPASWLEGHGWRAEVHKAADLFRAHNRPLPPSLEADAPGAPLAWLASAVRL
jgi:methyltransferase (TIGR00027 family)